MACSVGGCGGWPGAGWPGRCFSAGMLTATEHGAIIPDSTAAARMRTPQPRTAARTLTLSASTSGIVGRQTQGTLGDKYTSNHKRAFAFEWGYWQGTSPRSLRWRYRRDVARTADSSVNTLFSAPVIGWCQADTGRWLADPRHGHSRSKRAELWSWDKWSVKWETGLMLWCLGLDGCSHKIWISSAHRPDCYTQTDPHHVTIITFLDDKWLKQ